MNTKTIKTTCHKCGAPAEVFDPGDEYMRGVIMRYAMCEDCKNKFNADSERRRNEIKYSQYMNRMEESRIPFEFITDRETGEVMEKPIKKCENIARWIYKHDDSNIILSGLTGSGKTTSACFVASVLCRNHNAIPYYMTMTELLSSYVNTKRDDRANVNTLIRDMSSYTHLIIDECIGKGKVTPTGQEFLHTLTDAIYSHRISTKVWMLGNFYAGAVRTLFSDPDPAVRRLNEPNWARCVIMPDGKIKEVMIA